MTRTAAIAFVMVGVAAVSFAQQPNGAEQIRLGRAALAAHDPATAIKYFEHVDTREGREGLAVALMTESRSAADSYVERAFDAAMQSRAEPSVHRSRSELAAALRPGDLVIAFLIGDTAWAWAFDRDGFAGYPLPAPAVLATAAERARAYIKSGDRDGIARIADDLMPALLGPALERLPAVKRLLIVADGPLKDLPLGAFPPGQGQAPLAQQIAVSVVDYGGLLDAITAEPPVAAADSPWRLRSVVVAAIAAGIVLSLLALRQSRARS